VGNHAPEKSDGEEMKPAPLKGKRWSNAFPKEDGFKFKDVAAAVAWLASRSRCARCYSYKGCNCDNVENVAYIVTLSDIRQAFPDVIEEET